MSSLTNMLVLASPLITIGIVAALVWFLRHYIAEKAKVIAREGADRALEDHRLENQKLLSAIADDHQRRLQEFSLFTQRRHQTYARIYARARIAADEFRNLHAWFRRVPRYSEWSTARVYRYLEKNDVDASEPLAARTLVAFEERKMELAAELMEELDYKVRHARAEKAFRRMGNYEALHELYWSEEIRTAMDGVRAAIVAVSVRSDYDEREDQDTRLKLPDKISEVSAALATLFSRIREELRAGSAARDA